MREVTNLMINEMGLQKLHLDMMGFSVQRRSDFSFHHMLVPKCQCKRQHIPCDGYLKWNGAILNGKTGHPYLHVIGEYDDDLFRYITAELHDENVKGYVDVRNLREIRKMLEDFEDRYRGFRNKNGNRVVKDTYLIRPRLDDELCENVENVKKMVLTRRR